MQCSWANAACWIFPGLCRTCEIFGVNELVVSNLKLLEEKQFQSLSVTAEKWIKITEVSEFHRVSPSSCVFTFSYVHQVKLASLREYLLSMRGQGYSLVGVEQTAQSKCITKYQFQRKTVLVLGCVCTYYMNCHIWCGDNNRDLHIGNCMIKKNLSSAWVCIIVKFRLLITLFYHEVKLHLMQDESILCIAVWIILCSVHCIHSVCDDLSYAP